MNFSDIKYNFFRNKTGAGTDHVINIITYNKIKITNHKINVKSSKKIIYSKCQTGLYFCISGKYFFKRLFKQCIFLPQNESESYLASVKNLDHSLAKAGHVKDKYVPFPSSHVHLSKQSKVDCWSKVKSQCKSQVGFSFHSGRPADLVIIILNKNLIEDRLFANSSLAFYLAIILLKFCLIFAGI